MTEARIERTRYLCAQTTRYLPHKDEVTRAAMTRRRTHCSVIFFVAGSIACTSLSSQHAYALLLGGVGFATNNAIRRFSPLMMTATAATSPSGSVMKVGKRMVINESYAGLQQVHFDPDVYIIHNFLSDEACKDLIQKAEQKGTTRSPVAYAGWTTDFKDLLGLAATGPVTWIALFSAWYEAQGNIGGGVPLLVVHALRNYISTFAVAVIAVGAFVKWRSDTLGELRTSTSTTLDELNQNGAREFVIRATELFNDATSSSSSSVIHPASYFEAPTVIRYEQGQSLAPHYDANRSADIEDVNRGGQTLSTLIVYLNDVTEGGVTRFGKLPIDDIVPRRGDALLFFPADSDGNFDERTEHEGRPAVDAKYIARIWRHAARVPPPFGLSDSSIRDHL